MDIVLGSLGYTLGSAGKSSARNRGQAARVLGGGVVPLQEPRFIAVTFELNPPGWVGLFIF